LILGFSASTGGKVALSATTRAVRYRYNEVSLGKSINMIKKNFLDKVRVIAHNECNNQSNYLILT